MSHPILPLHGLAECCVFVKQSHGPFRCASGHCPGGPLLPKLRGHVAEFLNEVSPARLGILVPSHLCRFWYGRRVNTRGLFLEAGTHGAVGANPSGARPFPAVRGIAIDPLHCPSPNHAQTPAGAGMLTCRPSTTPFGLVLGAD